MNAAQGYTATVDGHDQATQGWQGWEYRPAP